MLLLAWQPASAGLPGDLKECNDKTIPLMDCPSGEQRVCFFVCVRCFVCVPCSNPPPSPKKTPGAFVSPDDMYNPYLMQALGAGRAEENIIKVKNGAASAAKVSGCCVLFGAKQRRRCRECGTHSTKTKTRTARQWVNFGSRIVTGGFERGRQRDVQGESASFSCTRESRACRVFADVCVRR